MKQLGLTVSVTLADTLCGVADEHALLAVRLFVLAVVHPNKPRHGNSTGEDAEQAKSSREARRLPRPRAAAAGLPEEQTTAERTWVVGSVPKL